MPNIRQVTPFMYADDFEDAIAFWRDTLGFTVCIRTETYAYVDREGAGVRIMASGFQYRGQRPLGRPFRYYFDVNDLASLYAELRPRLEALPDDYVHGPIDQSYGQRELMIQAPDGGVVIFGQAMRPVPA